MESLDLWRQRLSDLQAQLWEDDEMEEECMEVMMMSIMTQAQIHDLTDTDTDTERSPKGEKDVRLDHPKNTEHECQNQEPFFPSKNKRRVELFRSSGGGGDDPKCCECAKPGHLAGECRLRTGAGELRTAKRRPRRRSRSPRHLRSPSYGSTNSCSPVARSRSPSPVVRGKPKSSSAVVRRLSKSPPPPPRDRPVSPVVIGNPSAAS